MTRQVVKRRETTWKPEYLMELDDVKITRGTKPEGRKGRVISVSFKGVRVLTPEDRARLEAAAKRPNDKRRYPVIHEA